MGDKKFSKNLLAWFLQGLLFTAPVSLTIYIIYKSFRIVDGILTDVILEIFGFRIPGLGMVVILGTITLIGFLGSSIVFRPLFLTSTN
ncbi:MAG: hypothetical protein IPF68_16015 [Bacteroidales bacterium]|nr:hypothetical protein [Bacteroidales bacterium]